MWDISIKICITAALYAVYQSAGFYYALVGLIGVYAVMEIVPRLFGYEPVSGNDAIWMLDSDINKMYVTSFAVYERCGPEPIRNSMVYRSLDLDSRSKKVIKKFMGNYYWVKDSKFDVDYHFKVLDLELKSKDDLAKLLSKLSTQDMDFNRPLWEMYFIRNYLEDKSVTLLRFHHVMADGLAIVSMTGSSADPEIPAEYPSLPKISPVMRFIGFSCGLFLLPITTISKLMWTADRNPLHGQVLTGRKNIYFTDALDLTDIKSFCKERHVTLNDYYTACIIRALNLYSQKYHNQSLGSLISYIPYSLRDLPKTGCIPLSNDFAALIARMPADSPHILEDCKKLFNKLKNSFEPFTILLQMRAMALLLPRFISIPLLNFCASKATFLFSNVPGPANTIYYNKVKLLHLVSMSPMSGNCGISITSFSTNGKMVITCYADEAIIPVPKDFISILQQVCIEMKQNN